MYDLVGKLLRKIRKEYNPVKVPQELKEQMLKRFERPALESIRKKIYFPDFFPPFQYYFMDDKGRLFVMTYEKGTNPREFLYDIFNPEGIFIGRTKLSNYGNFLLTQRKSPFYVVAKNNRLYYVREKESGYMELVVYKMQWDFPGKKREETYNNRNDFDLKISRLRHKKGGEIRINFKKNQ